MKNEENAPIGEEHVPEQYKGSEMNAVEELVCDTEADAIRIFNVVKQRLLDVNNWGEIAELPMSSFRLTDALGQEIPGPAKEGDYFKIDIPGPGTEAGKGFDWVVVESIKAEKNAEGEYLSMRVRPVANPSGESSDVAHFLEDAATSTFQVKRMGTTITAEEHGRNEVPNTDTDKTLDNARNSLVGWGAKLGLSYPQWKGLVMGLLDFEK